MTIDYSQDGKIIYSEVDVELQTGTLKTTHGSIAGLHGEFLQRVDTGEWEKPQANVDYFSPNQERNNPIIRRFVSGTVTAGSLVSLIADASVGTVWGSLGYVTRSTDSYLFEVNSDQDDGSLGSALFRDSSGNLKLQLGTNINAYNLILDYIRIVQPSTTPGSLVQPITDPTVLQRADTGVWETAQTGVEYFSPNQRGGIYGKILIRFFSGTTEASADTTVLSSCGWNGIYSYGGYVDNTTAKLELKSYLSTGGFGGLRIESDAVVLRVGTAFYSYSYFLHAEYTKTSPPSLSPTGQPFADPSSPMLKRVDTGVYETPQAEVEYYSKNQYLGTDVKCMLFDLGSGGVTTEADTAFPTQPASTPTAICLVEGYLKHSSGYTVSTQGLSNSGWAVLFKVVSGATQYYIDAVFSDGFYIWIHYV